MEAAASHPHASRTDDPLAALARDCWDRACRVSQPQYVEADARAALQAMTEDIAVRARHPQGVCVLRTLLSRDVPILAGRAVQPFDDRLHRAMWSMARALFETALDDATFPYLRVVPDRADPDRNHYLPIIERAAKDIVRGFEQIGLTTPDGTPYVPTVEAVRKVIERLPTSDR